MPPTQDPFIKGSLKGRSPFKSNTSPSPLKERGISPSQVKEKGGEVDKQPQSRQITWDKIKLYLGCTNYRF